MIYEADHNHQNHNSACAQPLIGPGESDLVSDLGAVIDPDQRWGREEDLDQSKLLPEQTDSGYYEELIRPKKLHNPIKASKSHRELQRELIITHKRGAVAEEKPELQRVLEQRNRAQVLKQDRKQEEEKSPLEQELLKRQMRLEKFEREVEEQRERSKCAPEFIRVKESLKRTAITSAVEKEL
ncbi:protein FAM107B-like isoform X3 [Sinocyclocheilus rhinocerous]|uniref:protein FAM107B-like isoform X3 n=1 Tax=Sinocyclocheilus rhinocerous TaxID=307959 RepID=UPI0007B83C33|nr:PREDICTED: protein FAM107B-like isoform X3 [Sinocyclocheilus rhinocerous]